MADFFKYDVQCGMPDAQCGEPDATAGEKHKVVIIPLCGETFAQAGEPDALAGNYEDAFNNISLAVTENLDTVAALINNSVSADFATTENQDVAALVTVAGIATTLNVTEAVDSAALQSTVEISADLAATETMDAAAFTASVIADRDASLSVTEARDGVHIAVNHRAQPEPQQITVPYSSHVFIPDREADLKSTEAPDVCLLKAETVKAAILSVSENADGLKITAEYIENFYNKAENLVLILALMNRRK